MATTIFSHQHCEGNVVLDLTAAIKFISPSFAVTPQGLAGLVLDVQTEKTSGVIPIWTCQSCGREVPPEEIVSACLVCGDTKPIAELYTHETIACACGDCVKELKGDAPRKQQLRRYKEFFGITRSSVFVCIRDVVSSRVRV